MSVDLPPESILKNFHDNKAESSLDAKVLDYRLESTYGKSPEYHFIKSESNQHHPGTPYLDKLITREIFAGRKRSIDSLLNMENSPFPNPRSVGSIDESFRNNKADTPILLNLNNHIPPQIEDRISSFFQSDRELRWAEVKEMILKINNFKKIG
jgi:hypothetical protein